ncbi:MAG: CheF family chemotaxis protein [Natronomonas sp.]
MTQPIADFVGRFSHGSSREPDLVDGRILMNRAQLVLAADRDNTLSISLDDIFDVSVGHVPPKFEGFFDDTVTLGYRTDDGRRTVVIEGDGDSIERFVGVLLKSLLHGVEVIVRHPARVGGRITDTEFCPAKLAIDRQSVGFVTKGERISIELPSVTNFDQFRKDFDGDERTMLAVHHFSDARTQVTLVVPPSGRVVNILGRHLRLEYNDLRAAVADIDLSTSELEALVALYTAGDGIDIASVLPGEATEINTVTRSLNDKGLIVDDESGTHLTPEGRVVVADRMEQVNA